MALVLASKSPRRRELMALVSRVFETDDSGIDERGITAKTPRDLAVSLAAAKAAAVAARRPNDVVIGCDTLVEAGGRVLGKPRSVDEVIGMLSAISGRRHLVHTGVCIAAAGITPYTFAETTEVTFAPLPKDEVAAYAATGEAYDKAGGYAIQGWAARYITGVAGCFYNVCGLPVAALYRGLVSLGFAPLGAPPAAKCNLF